MFLSKTLRPISTACVAIRTFPHSFSPCYYYSNVILYIIIPSLFPLVTHDVSDLCAAVSYAISFGSITACNSFMICAQYRRAINVPKPPTFPDYCKKVIYCMIKLNPYSYNQFSSLLSLKQYCVRQSNQQTEPTKAVGSPQLPHFNIRALCSDAQWCILPLIFLTQYSSVVQL